MLHQEGTVTNVVDHTLASSHCSFASLLVTSHVPPPPNRGYNSQAPSKLGELQALELIGLEGMCQLQGHLVKETATYTTG